VDKLASGVTVRFNMKNPKYGTNYCAVSNYMKKKVYKTKRDLNALTGSEHQTCGEKVLK
jgi:hypothetical protein